MFYANSYITGKKPKKEEIELAMEAIKRIAEIKGKNYRDLDIEIENFKQTMERITK